MAGEMYAGSTSSDQGSETIVINVKTLDSQTHSFQIVKSMTVQGLKEKIVEETGVPIEQQRLIFRGKVLKDSHALSEYGLEDGHTLHLVVRQPSETQTAPGPSTGMAARTEGNEPASGPHPRIGQVSHSLVLGTVNVIDQGEGVMPEIQRIVGAVANSLGLGGGNPIIAAQVNPGTEIGAANVGGRSQTSNIGQAGFAHNNPFHGLNLVPQFPSAAPLPTHVVVVDSLTTLSEYINRMELALQNVFQSSPPPANAEGPPMSESASTNSRTIPTPEVLGSVIERTRQLLTGNAASALSDVAGRLEREGLSPDPLVRDQIQNEVTRLGVAIQQLGAMLLELGRTTMTLHMGRSPSESFVNAGPAVYISASGPNPIMVQPFPLQTSLLFGVSSPPITAVPGPVGVVDPSRNINIHIHAGTSIVRGLPPTGGGNNHRENVQDRQNPPSSDQGIANGNVSGVPAPTNTLPPSAIVAAIPSRNVPEGSNRILNVIYPTFVNSQPAVAGHLGPTQGAQSSRSNGAHSSSSSVAPQPSSDPNNPTDALVREINENINSSIINSQIHGENSIYSTLGCQGETSYMPESVDDFVPSTEGPSVVDKVISCEQRENSAGKKTDLIGIEDASTSGKNSNLNELQLPQPLGLGLGGLHPKRRSKPIKPVSRESGSQNATSASESFAPDIINANGGVTPLPQTSGPVDISSVMSRALQSPAFGRLVSGLSEQTGISSPDLRGIMEQCTQSPAIRNMVNSLAPQMNPRGEGFEGRLPTTGRGQSGIDFSSMLQQMMPIVSQVIGGGTGSSPFGAFASEPSSEVISQNSDVNHVEDGKDRQVDVEQVIQRIEQGDSRESIFRAALQSAGSLSGADNIHNLVEELSRDPELTDQFIGVLKDQLRERMKKEQQSKGGCP